MCLSRRPSSAASSRKSSLSRSREKQAVEEAKASHEAAKAESLRVESLARIREKQAARSIQRGWRKHNAAATSQQQVGSCLVKNV